MLANSHAKIIKDTANAAGANNATAYGMNNDCMRKFGANGDAGTSVDSAVMQKREKELNAIEQAICSLNFNSLISGLLGLNLNICKGGQLVGGGINDTLSGTYLSKAHDLTKEKACLQAKATTTNTMTNVTSPNGYGMTAASGGLGVLSAAGLQPGGGGGWNFGFGTNVSTGVNVSGGNVTTTTTTTPTTPTSTTPVVAPTPPSSGAVSGTSGVVSTTGPGVSTGTVSAPASNLYK